MSPEDPLERLIAAITAGDIESVREIYAPDAVIWHNVGEGAQSVDDNVRLLRWYARQVPERSYEEVRRQRTERGFVQQHVLRGTTAAGERLEAQVCLVVETEGDRITRLFEYVDSEQIAPLMRAAAPR
jgi:ketosteroid isomerase-like protein